MDDRGNLETYSRTMREPAALVVGDSWQWTKELADFPATDGWTLTYYLDKGDGQAPKTFNAATDADGTSYDVTVDAATTAGFSAGSWRWTAVVTKTGSRFTVDAGRFTLLADPSKTATLSFARQALAVLEVAVLAGVAKFVGEYQIAGRSYKFRTFDEMLKARDAFRAEVRREELAEQLARGGGQHGSNMVKVRLKGWI